MLMLKIGSILTSKRILDLLLEIFSFKSSSSPLYVLVGWKTKRSVKSIPDKEFTSVGFMTLKLINTKAFDKLKKMFKGKTFAKELKRKLKEEGEENDFSPLKFSVNVRRIFNKEEEEEATKISKTYLNGITLFFI